MRKNSAILHMSDLHLIDFHPSNDDVKFSYVNENNDYLNAFIDSVKEESKDSVLSYIFITGDIANGGKRQEYERALFFLNKLSKDLNILIDNIIIVPGNHDINWTDIDKYIEDENYTDDPYKLHDTKFEKYTKFISDLYEERKHFTPNHPVSEFKIDKDNQLIILGLNSNYYESQKSQNHKGFITHDVLREFLNENINDSYASFGRIVLLHHHYSTFLKTENNSWSKVEEVLNKYDFSVFIHGHNHNDNSNAIDDGEINRFVGVGSFAKKDDKIINSYNLFFNNNSEIEFKIHTYHYVDKSTNKPYWQYQSKIRGKRDFKIYSAPINLDVAGVNKLDIPQVDDFNPEALGSEYSLVNFAFKESDKLTNNKYELIRFIKDNKLYKTGHFHWTEDFRSHGLIDVFSLINNKKCQNLIIESFKEIITIKSITVNKILGVGFEGNVIGALLSLEYPNCSYTYITSSDDYFNEFEKKVEELSNVDIMIVEDVIFQADSLKKFLNDNKHIVDKINNIFLMTMFFCGNDEDLIEISRIPKLKFNYIFDEIKIEACPYKTDMKKCSILSKGLDTYYKFY